MGCIVDNWHLQSVKVRKRIIHPAHTHAFDHLNFEKISTSAARLAINHIAEKKKNLPPTI
jgi:hypothetical protein